MLHPLRVTYRGTNPSPSLTEHIEGEVAELQRFFEHIVSAHVVVEHHRVRSGENFRVHVELDVPRQRLVAESKADASADARMAVASAFEVARRVVQDYAQRLRGEVKHHAA